MDFNGWSLHSLVVEVTSNLALRSNGLCDNPKIAATTRIWKSCGTHRGFQSEVSIAILPNGMDEAFPRFRPWLALGLVAFPSGALALLAVVFVEF